MGVEVMGGWGCGVDGVGVCCCGGGGIVGWCGLALWQHVASAVLALHARCSPGAEEVRHSALRESSGAEMLWPGLH